MEHTYSIHMHALRGCLELPVKCRQFGGGGTGPADPAATRPILAAKRRTYTCTRVYRALLSLYNWLQLHALDQSKLASAAPAIHAAKEEAGSTSCYKTNVGA